MILLDLLIEPIAPVLDFWVFDGGEAPLQNYIGWTAVALFLQIIFSLFSDNSKGMVSPSVVSFTNHFLCRIVDKANYYWYLKF